MEKINKIIEPTFALFFQLTTKAGNVPKETLAKRWTKLPPFKRVDIYNKALSDNPKINPDYYLNIGK